MSDQHKRPAWVITPQHEALEEDAGRSEVRSRGPWIQLDVRFREEFLARLKGARLSVFLAVALHIDGRFQAHPSIDTIADETGYDRKAILGAVSWLEANGLLRKVVEPA